MASHPVTSYQGVHGTPQGITADISIHHLVQDRIYWVSLTAGSWRGGVRKTSPTVKGEREDSCSHPGYGGCLRGIFGILLEGMFVVLAFIHFFHHLYQNVLMDNYLTPLVTIKFFELGPILPF